MTRLNRTRRHGRTCSGHPRLCSSGVQDVDARDKRGHDDRLWKAVFRKDQRQQ
jgi:hypothetical protein